MGQAQINVRTRACSRASIARTKQAALTHNVRGKELKWLNFSYFFLVFLWGKFGPKKQNANIRTPGILTYKHDANFATVFWAQFKTLQGERTPQTLNRRKISKCHKYAVLFLLLS